MRKIEKTVPDKENYSYIISNNKITLGRKYLGKKIDLLNKKNEVRKILKETGNEIFLKPDIIKYDLYKIESFQKKLFATPQYYLPTISPTLNNYLNKNGSTPNSKYQAFPLKQYRNLNNLKSEDFIKRKNSFYNKENDRSIMQGKRKNTKSFSMDPSKRNILLENLKKFL